MAVVQFAATFLQSWRNLGEPQLQQALRHRTPPPDLSLEHWWMGLKFARNAMARDLPLSSADGSPFRFSNVDLIQEVVHRIDQQASGQILSDGLVSGLRSSNRYLFSSLVEEAITSSQLELVTRQRVGTKFVFRAVPDLPGRLRSLSAP